MRYLAFQTKKDYPSIFEKWKSQSTGPDDIDPKVIIQQKIQAQTTDYTRAFNCALTILNTLFGDLKPDLNVTPESNHYLLPQFPIDPDIAAIDSTQALPNNPPLFMINTRPKFLDYVM